MLKISLIIIIAFILRVFFILGGGVSFHYDMARDAFIVLQILQGDFKLLGPPTSTPGLFHGVLYYYLLAPFYKLGQGDPKIVAMFLSFINSLTIIPLVLLAKDFLKNKKWVYLAAVLFAVSFEAIQYAGWISNPAPAVLTVALFFYFLRIWQKGNVRGLYLAIFMAVLSTQFQFFLIYLLVLIPFFGLIFKLKVNKFELLKSLLLIFLLTSNFFLAAIKFKSISQILNGFINISQGSQVDFRLQFSELFLNYVNKFTELFSYNFVPQNIFLGGILAFATLYILRKERFLLFCLLSNLPIFIFGGHTNTYANIGLAVPAIIGTVMLLKKINTLNKVSMVLLFSLILFSNMFAIYKHLNNGQIILVIPNDMNLKNELSLIDQTYKLAENQPFSINTLTLPLWTNTTWAYLYSWYGKDKFGYVPSFIGHDQIGLLGVDSLPRAEKPSNKTFFILEPHVGIPEDIYSLEIGSENSKTDLIRQYEYGELILQYRKPKTNE